MSNHAKRIACLLAVLAVAILAAGCDQSDTSENADPELSASAQRSPSCAITDPKLFLLTRSWRLVVASYGYPDHPRYATAFYEMVDELIDDSDDCPGAVALSRLGVQAALIQGNALSGSPGQRDLASAVRSGNQWLTAMAYTETKFQAPSTQEAFQTFAGDIFTVALVDTRSSSAEVRFCATAPYQNGCIPVTRGPWSMQDDQGTFWPADDGGGRLPGNAYPVEATVSVGDCLQGWLRFDVPRSIKPIRVVYDSSIGGPFSWEVTSAGTNGMPNPPASQPLTPSIQTPTYTDSRRDCYTLESAASPFSGNWLTLETRGQFTAEALTVQDRLNWLGYGCIPEDGDYGPVTREAVMRFQRDFGLVVDGKVGPQTWGTLFTYY